MILHLIVLDKFKDKMFSSCQAASPHLVHAKKIAKSHNDLHQKKLYTTRRSFSRRRSRQSEKQPIIVELALIEHAHMGRSFRTSRIAAMCHRSSDYYRTGLCCDDYPSVNTRDGRIDFIGSTQKTRINAIFLRNRTNSSCMFFLSMYTFII